MAEELVIPDITDRALAYEALIPQVRALVGDEPDPVAVMANTAAAIKQVFNWLWVGFYRVSGNELVLGPFQGPIACARIGFGQGVCGSAWAEQRTIIVPDVDLFPGHIACSSAARSEIVLPIRGRQGSVVAVLDIDSDQPDSFSSVDAEGLRHICAPLEQLLT